MRSILLISIFVLNLSPLNLYAEESLVDNPSFEQDFKGWNKIWSREPGAATASIDSKTVHQSLKALKVESETSKDWAISQEKYIPVISGEVYFLSGWVNCRDVKGGVQLSVITYGEQGKVLNWLWGLREASGTDEWKYFSGKFYIPKDCVSIQLRITGYGPGLSYWDDIGLKKAGNIQIDSSLQPVTIVSSNDRLIYSPTENTIQVVKGENSSFLIDGWGESLNVLSLQIKGDSELDLILGDNTFGSIFSSSVSLDGTGDYFFSLNGDTYLKDAIQFPGPILSTPEQNWVVPINEGLYIPSTDPFFKTGDLVLYSGHGLSMPFIGLTNGREGLLAISQTQNDAKVRFLPPIAGKTSQWSFWCVPSRQSFGYERKIVLKIVPIGGYVGIAKAYRSYAKLQGLLVTLKEKQAANPNVDKLIGAVDLWWWQDRTSGKQDLNDVIYASQMKEAGIDKVLWSHQASPNSIKSLNNLGFLTSRYDIYQVAYGPDAPAYLNKIGWPECLALLPSGDWIKGWVTHGTNGDYTGGVICSSCSLDMAKQRIPDDLKIHDYLARFIDTTSASPLQECYSPQHPLTRDNDRQNKMNLLDYISNDLRLVAGSETGMDMAVPYLDYFEGMMSIVPYRLPNSGYDLFSIMTPQDGFLRFQIGPYYRIPLFELVYHDCVVSYWYWGDSSNRLPEYWEKRDLFNALYGTPPLWVLDRMLWNDNRNRFIQSYKSATETAQKTGYSEMLSHEFLTKDHTVQKTEFSNGIEVWVNFAGKPYSLTNGTILGPNSSKIIANSN
jgi:hypothetical protein